MKLKAAPVRLYMPYLIFAFLEARRHLSQKSVLHSTILTCFFLNKSFTITRNWVSFIYYPTEQSRVQITRIKTSDKMYIPGLNRKTSNSLRGWDISIKVFFSTKINCNIYIYLGIRHKRKKHFLAGISKKKKGKPNDIIVPRKTDFASLNRFRTMCHGEKFTSRRKKIGNENNFLPASS